MKKIYNKLDSTLLVLLSLLMVVMFYYDISDLAFLTVNDLLIVLLFIFSVRLVFFRSTFGQYLLFFLIVFAIAGVVTFTYTIGNATYSSHSSFHAGSISFDPLSFLLLLLFMVINRRSIFDLIYGSDGERKDKKEKLEKFYYDRFKKLTPNEFNDTVLMFEDYPDEAKAAINKLKGEIRSGEFIRD
ncbi:hypothetical protein KXQ82_11815 [Mucilaginibacter sp. HMF5004]|uniref:hypothetical protein n=1 Tax=Mucilaginibacter rivuli TaxID=2857527 RepID=UPI001C5F2699|nr:hypothetical protein [Mucilaginibacter rivuli]MBW4890412.1 hypothetical protein [Mucilaginibacter rivuli]